MAFTHLLPTCGLSAHFVDCFLYWAGAFEFGEVSLIYFFPVLWASYLTYPRQDQYQGAFSLFSSRRVMVPGLTFKSLVRFAGIVVGGLRQG